MSNSAGAMGTRGSLYLIRFGGATGGQRESDLRDPQRLSGDTTRNVRNIMKNASIQAGILLIRESTYIEGRWSYMQNVM